MPSEQAEKFIQWNRRRNGPLSRGLSLNVLDQLLGQYSDTREGRETLARAYATFVQNQVQNAVTSGISLRYSKEVCLRVEEFIPCFPEEERFSEPLLGIRESLKKLYAYMGLRYGREDSSGEVDRVSRYRRTPVI